MEAADGQIGHQRGGQHGQEAQGQMPLVEQQDVTHGAHGAEAAALGQEAHQQTGTEREQEGGVHGAGALEGVEEDAVLGLSFHGRVEQIDGDQGEHDAGQDQAGRLALALAAAQGEAHAEEDRAQTDADHQAGQAEQGVGVAAGQTHDDAPGAAQEDQGADGCDDAQQEADGRSGAAAGAVFAKAEGSGQGAQHHAHDLGTQVLDDGRAVQAHGPCDVAVEADHADAHVAGVAGELQKDGYQAQEKARDHDARGGREEIEAVFHATPQKTGCGKS